MAYVARGWACGSLLQGGLERGAAPAAGEARGTARAHVVSRPLPGALYRHRVVQVEPACRWSRRTMRGRPWRRAGAPCRYAEGTGWGVGGTARE